MLGRFPFSLHRSCESLLVSSRRRGLSAMAGVGGRETRRSISVLRNYELSGVPCGVGTVFHDGFDIGRLFRRLDDPHNHFPEWISVGNDGSPASVGLLRDLFDEGPHIF